MPQTFSLQNPTISLLRHNGAKPGGPSLVNCHPPTEPSSRTFTIPEIKVENSTPTASRRINREDQGDHQPRLDWLNLPGVSESSSVKRNFEASHDGTEVQTRKLQDLSSIQIPHHETNLADWRNHINELEKQLVITRSKLRIQQAIHIVSSERISTLSSCLRAALQDIETVALEFNQGLGSESYRTLTSAFLNTTHYRDILMLGNSKMSPAQSHYGELVPEGRIQQPMLLRAPRASEISLASQSFGFETSPPGHSSLTLPPIHVRHAGRSSDEVSFSVTAQQHLKNHMLEFQGNTKSTSGTHHQSWLQSGLDLDKFHLVPRDAFIASPSGSHSHPLRERSISIPIPGIFAASTATVNIDGNVGNKFSVKASNAITHQVSGNSACNQTRGSSGPTTNNETLQWGLALGDSLPIDQHPKFVLDHGVLKQSEVHASNSIDAFDLGKVSIQAIDNESLLEDFWRCDQTWDLPRSFSDDAISVRLASQKLQYFTRSPPCSPSQLLNAGRPLELPNDAAGPHDTDSHHPSKGEKKLHAPYENGPCSSSRNPSPGQGPDNSSEAPPQQSKKRNLATSVADNSTVRLDKRTRCY